MDNNENKPLDNGVGDGFNSNTTSPSADVTPTAPTPPTPQPESKDLPNAPGRATMPSTGKEPETMVVKRDALDKLLERVDAIEKENKMLKEIADKGRLAQWETNNKGDVAKIYRMSEYQGKVITSWEMKKNRVWKDEKGLWKEQQEIEINTEDGQTLTLPYIEFVTNTQKIEASLLSTETKGQKTYLTLDVGGGKKITLDSVFIN